MAVQAHHRPHAYGVPAKSTTVAALGEPGRIEGSTAAKLAASPPTEPSRREAEVAWRRCEPGETRRDVPRRHALRTGLARCPPITAADPVGDQAAVLLRCFLPGEVARVEGMDLIVREKVGEILVVRPRHEGIIGQTTIWVGVVIDGSSSCSTLFCSG